MIESKAWQWKEAGEELEDVFINPSVESYYLLNRWSNQGKKSILDLGCGIGRHTILFAKNNFDTYAFDLSEVAIRRTKEWADSLALKVDYKIGDMLELPYQDNQFDCILCRNVISHTDTIGMRKIVSELKRVLKKDGECYLTLGSKTADNFNNPDFPKVDENTSIRIEEGPENGIPHFYADYDLIQELFKDFKIELINQIEDIFFNKNKLNRSWHYHLLVRKTHS